MSIAENLHAVQARVAEAALRSGREPGEIVLVGATKMNDAARIQEAIGAGRTWFVWAPPYSGSGFAPPDEYVHVVTGGKGGSRCCWR